MRGATRAMGAMNKQMNLPALTKIMREFERQNERMEMTSEMMGDAVDDAFEVLLASVFLGLRKSTAVLSRHQQSVTAWLTLHHLPRIASQTLRPATKLFTRE